MGKYSEVSSSTETNASAPCSVEFALKAHFPDDKQQTYPAEGIPYKAYTPQGLVEGTLDGNGEVIIPDTGIGSVHIEILPDLEKDLIASRMEIQTILNELIAQEKAEAKAIQANYDNASWLKKRGYDIEAAASGVGSFFEGVWGAITGIGSAIGAVAEELGEYIKHPLNIPETFKEDVKAIKAKYKALEKFANEDLENYFLLMSDEKTQDIFTDFAGDYYDAQHYSEVIEGGSEAVTGIILTVITAGAGAAVAGGATASRLAITASKLKAPIDKIIKALKNKVWFKKNKPVQRETVQANRRHEQRYTLLLKKRVKCFCVGDHNKGGREEYERQLKHQQDGLNNTTADEYVRRRQAYTGKDICGEGYGDGKITARDPNVTRNANLNRITQQKDKYFDELIAKGISDRKAEALAIAKAQAEVTGTEVGVFQADGTPKLNKDGTQRIQNIGGQDPLHNQDMAVGGQDMIGERPGLIEFRDENFGSSDVNRHIGTQWNGGRATDIDQQACAARANGAGEQRLNVELKACGKHNSSHCPKNRGTTHRKPVQ